MNRLSRQQRQACARLAVALDLPPELNPPPTGLTPREQARRELAAAIQLTVDAICAQLTETHLPPAEGEEPA